MDSLLYGFDTHETICLVRLFSSHAHTQTTTAFYLKQRQLNGMFYAYVGKPCPQKLFDMSSYFGADGGIHRTCMMLPPMTTNYPLVGLEMLSVQMELSIAQKK
jgi:hypothetical protein